MGREEPFAESKVSKYLKAGREMARAYLNEGELLRPPRGISNLAIVRGLSDYLTIAALYKLEQDLKSAEISSMDKINILKVASSLSTRLREKTARAQKGKTVKKAQPAATSEAETLSDEDLRRFDQEHGFGESGTDGSGEDEEE